MKMHAWYLVVAGLGTLGVGSACTVTTVNNGDDSGATAMINEGGTGAESSTPDAGTTGNDAGTGTEGSTTTCSLPITTGVPGCDMCLEQNCCQLAIACDTADDAGVDDAGQSKCEQLIGCVSDCVNPPAGTQVEAGTEPTCFMTCGASYSATQMSNAMALISCQSTSCAMACQ